MFLFPFKLAVSEVWVMMAILEKEEVLARGETPDRRESRATEVGQLP